MLKCSVGLKGNNSLWVHYYEHHLTYSNVIYYIVNKKVLIQTSLKL